LGDQRHENLKTDAPTEVGSGVSTTAALIAPVNVHFFTLFFGAVSEGYDRREEKQPKKQAVKKTEKKKPRGTIHL